MNKLLTRIVGATLGCAMAIGVGAGIGALNNRKEAKPVYAVNTATNELVFTINFKDNGTDSSTALTASTFYSSGVTSVVDKNNSNITSAFSEASVSNLAKVYPGNGGLKCGSNNNAASFTINIPEAYREKVSYVSLNCKNATRGITVTASGSSDSLDSGNSSFGDHDLEIDGSTNATTLAVSIDSASKTAAYIASISVYKAKAEAPTLSSIALSGSYPTTFTQGDEFSHVGMIVTATYSDSNTANVTSSATFSGYNMSQVGNQTVTVSYTEGGVTKTAAYGITVNEQVAVPATNISLNKSSGTLAVGDTVTLTATVEPDNSTDDVEWSTSNESIATVFSGVVTAVAVGNATITATAGTKTAVFSLEVVALTALTNYVGANIDTVGQLMFKNGKNGIVDDGTGAFWVYATSNISQNVGSKVRIQGESINYSNRGGLEVNNATVSSASGDPVVPSTAQALTESEVISYINAFKTSNQNTVPHRRVSLRTGVTGASGNFITWTWPEGTALMETNVSSGGMVAGKSYDIDGYLLNFYSSGGDTYLCVCVIDATIVPTGITLDRTTLPLAVGDSETLTATINPDGATATVSWKTSNASVATVDGGTVTAEGSGNATITAFIDADGDGTVDTGEISADCVVTVEERTPSLYLTSAITEATLHGSEHYSLEDTADSITFSTLGLSNDTKYSNPFNGTNGKFQITFAGGANDGKYYTTGSGIRTYGNGTITVSSVSTINSITFTFSGASYKPESDNVANVGTYDSDTSIWTGSANSVTLTRPSGSGHWRLQGVEVELTENVYQSVDNVGIRFAAKISESDWNTIHTTEGWGIVDYGVMLADEDMINGYLNHSIADAYYNGVRTMVDLNRGSYVEPYLENGTYSFAVRVNVRNADDYADEIYAVPYIVVGTTHYFLNQIHKSVKSLATSFYTSGGCVLSQNALADLKA